LVKELEKHMGRVLAVTRISNYIWTSGANCINIWDLSLNNVDTLSFDHQIYTIAYVGRFVWVGNQKGIAIWDDRREHISTMQQQGVTRTLLPILISGTGGKPENWQIWVAHDMRSIFVWSYCSFA